MNDEATNASQFEEDMSRAAEELLTKEETATTEETQETKTEETQTQETKKEPEDNAERSRLGRKVADLEKLVLQQQELLKAKQEEKPQVDLDSVPTFAELDDYLERKNKEKENEKKEYQATFLSTVVGMEHDDEEIHAKALELMDADARFLKKHTGNAQFDAEKNYLLAVNTVLKGGKNPLKGKVPGALGAETTSTTHKETKSPKLDEAAARFARKWGLGEESIKDALS